MAHPLYLTAKMGMIKKQSDITDAAYRHRQELAGKGGPKAILQNLRIFGVVTFACIGGLLYGYNQGVFSGILASGAFQQPYGKLC